MEKTFNNAHLINVKGKIKEISEKVKQIVDRTNVVLNTSSEFGHRFMETTDKFLNDYASNQDILNNNDSDLIKKSLEFRVNFDRCASDFLRPMIRKDVSVLFDFNLNDNYNSDIVSYENLVQMTKKLNKNLTELLSLLSEKMDPFFDQIFTKYTKESCAFKINNNILISETNIASKPIYCPGYSWDVFSSISLVRDITNNKSFIENKKKFLAEVIPTLIENRHHGELYKKFWEQLTIQKSQNYLNTNFYLTSENIINKQANYLMDDLKYLYTLLKFLSGDVKTLQFANDADVLAEFAFIMDNIESNSFFHNELHLSEINNYSVLPISSLKEQVFNYKSLDLLKADGPDSNKQWSGVKRQKLMYPDYLKHSQNHIRSFTNLQPVDSFGNLIEASAKVDIEKYKEYSNLISKIYAPFGKLINNPNFKIYSHDYQFYKTYNFETNTYAKFLEHITNFQTYWSLIAKIFNLDTIKEFNETFLNSMCFDLTKSVFLVANSIILKTNIQSNISNMNDDEFKNISLKSILQSNPKLFPMTLSIRETASISSYLAEYHQEPDYEMSTIVNEFIYDSILLAPHVQILIMYCYGYFLKYLAFMSSNGLDRVTLENFELPINLDDNSFDFHFTSNSTDSLNCKNIYSFCLKLLTSSNTQDGKSLNQEGEVTLVIFILNKFMDFIYRALKINRFCEKEKHMTNISAELEEELKSSGHFTIHNPNDFEKYLGHFIRAANLTVNSICLNVFNYASIAHENSILCLSKIQTRHLARICLNKTTVAELANKPTFYNLNNNIFVFLYSSFKAQYPELNKADPLGFGPDEIKIPNKETFDMYNSVPSMDGFAKFYQKLSRKLGEDYRKFEHDKINSCFYHDTLPYRTQFVELPSYNTPIKHDLNDNNISSLFNIEITTKLLENLTYFSSKVSNKVTKLLSVIIEQKSFHLLENMAMQHFFKNKKLYIFNELGVSKTNISFKSYLVELLDESLMYINVKALLNQLEENEHVVEFFNKTPYLQRFKYFLQKNFSHTLDNNCNEHFLYILKPIQLSRVCFNFYLGVLIIFLWHSIFNKSLL